MGVHMRWALVVFAAVAVVGGKHSAAHPASQPAQAVREIRVVGTDYAFQVPTVVRAGPAVFVLVNNGRVAHEMLLAALRPGVTAANLAEAAHQGLLLQPLIERVFDGAPSGVLFALSGESSPGRLGTTLVRDHTYALVCNFKDSPTAARHMALGMFRTFRAE